MAKIFPVIHIHDGPQAVEQAGVAFEAGADGVYLIDHRSPRPDRLMACFNVASARYPDKFIGMNVLALPGFVPAMRHITTQVKIGRIGRLPDGLWVDNSFTHEDDLLADLQAAQALREQGTEHEAQDWRKVQLLGGVAFKYTVTYTDDPAEAAGLAQKASPYLDVVVTSGPGTGEAPEFDKVQAMKAVLGAQPLAIASGLDAENIADYNGYVDEVLIASGVETQPSSGVFDVQKLGACIAAAHAIQ